MPSYPVSENIGFELNEHEALGLFLALVTAELGEVSVSRWGNEFVVGVRWRARWSGEDKVLGLKQIVGERSRVGIQSAASQFLSKAKDAGWAKIRAAE